MPPEENPQAGVSSPQPDRNADFTILARLARADLAFQSGVEWGSGIKSRRNRSQCLGRRDYRTKVLRLKILDGRAVRLERRS